MIAGLESIITAETKIPSEIVNPSAKIKPIRNEHVVKIYEHIADYQQLSDWLCVVPPAMYTRNNMLKSLNSAVN